MAYDELVYALGAENNTFGIQGVPKYACFLKEIWDAEKIRTKLMDCKSSGDREMSGNRLADFALLACSFSHRHRDRNLQGPTSI